MAVTRSRPQPDLAPLRQRPQPVGHASAPPAGSSKVPDTREGAEAEREPTTGARGSASAAEPDADAALLAALFFGQAVLPPVAAVTSTPPSGTSAGRKHQPTSTRTTPAGLGSAIRSGRISPRYGTDLSTTPSRQGGCNDPPEAGTHVTSLESAALSESGYEREAQEEGVRRKSRGCAMLHHDPSGAEAVPVPTRSTTAIRSLRSPRAATTAPRANREAALPGGTEEAFAAAAATSPDDIDDVLRLLQDF